MPETVYPQGWEMKAPVPFVLCRNSMLSFSFCTICVNRDEIWEYCTSLSREQIPKRGNSRFTSSLSVLQAFCNAWRTSAWCCFSSALGASSRRCCKGAGVQPSGPPEGTCFSLSLAFCPVNGCIICTLVRPQGKTAGPIESQPGFARHKVSLTVM